MESGEKIGLGAGFLALVLFLMPKVRGAVVAGVRSSVGIAPSLSGKKWLDELVKLVAGFEGFKEKAYRDFTGVWTVGHGLTSIDGVKVREGDRMTLEQSFAAMGTDLTQRVAKIETFAGRKLTDGERICFGSWAYNLGTERIKTATFFIQWKAGQSAELWESNFKKWVYAKNPTTGQNEQLTGLVNRRIKEFNYIKTWTNKS